MPPSNKRWRPFSTIPPGVVAAPCGRGSYRVISRAKSPYYCAQNCASAARVGLLLFRAGPDEFLLLIESAGCAQSFKRNFHAAVFERMEGDYGQRSAGREQFRRDAQEIVERFQFAVDGDAQGLKRFRSRMNAAVAAHAQRAADQRFEFSRRVNGIGLALVDNCAGDAARFVFVTMLKKNVGDFFFAVVAQNVRGGAALRTVHAHVERLVGAETEATRGIVELQ